MLKIHPVAEMFPMMQGEEYERFKENIRDNGLQVPITIYDDMLLDGRNRYKACQELGIKNIPMEFYRGDSPVAFIMSHNLSRRHLDASQRASIATKILPHLEEEAKKRMEIGRPKEGVANLPQDNSGKARDQAAKMLNVSPRMVSDAKRIKHEAPELFKKVESGEMTVNKAMHEIKEEKPRVKTYDEEMGEQAQAEEKPISKKRQLMRELGFDYQVYCKIKMYWNRAKTETKAKFISEILQTESGRKIFESIKTTN